MVHQPFASVGVRYDCSSVNTLAPCEGLLFSIVSESSGESDCGARYVVVGIRTRLQAPCKGLLFSIVSESSGESDCGARDVMVGIRTRLQVNSDVSDKLVVWLSRDDVVKKVPIRGPGTVKYTRRASHGDGGVDESKLVVARKLQKQGSVAVNDPDVPLICPNYFTILLSYFYTSSSVSI